MCTQHIPPIIVHIFLIKYPGRKRNGWQRRDITESGMHLSVLLISWKKNDRFPGQIFFSLKSPSTLSLPSFLDLGQNSSVTTDRFSCIPQLSLTEAYATRVTNIGHKSNLQIYRQHCLLFVNVSEKLEMVFDGFWQLALKEASLASLVYG